jgi:kynurenine formamidase
MKIFDLSHPINSTTPVYPGTELPSITDFATFGTHGYREKKLIIHSHIGTHIDAPAHMIKDGKFLDDFDISMFTGSAVIISIPEGKKNITKSDVNEVNKYPAKFDFILFQTGWSKYWGREEYFRGFPVIEPEAMNYLLDFSNKGIGIDCISADMVSGKDYPNHQAILGKGLIIIENLKFPEELIDSTGEFSCLPLAIEKADGSPVRAILTIR